MSEMSGWPKIMAISGAIRPSWIAVMTPPPNAAPMTTPTASSIALPREMKSLNPPWNTRARPPRAPPSVVVRRPWRSASLMPWRPPVCRGENVRIIPR